MKYFLCLFLFCACGKNEMPKKVDLRDSDGDGTTNHYELTEIERYTAEITPIESVQVEMRIKLANSASTEFKINMSNQIDLTKLSRELLVKNSKHLPTDEYFSEWAKIKIDSGKVPALPDQLSFRIDLCFKQLESPPDKILLVTKSGTKELSDWSQTASFLLTKKELEDVLKGEIFFALSRKTKPFESSEESQEQSIKNKTYRVFINNGLSTKIYYVSRDYPFEEFLKAKNILKLQPISLQNLLKGRYLVTTPEWWVNEINGKDKVVVRDDLSSLSQFYLEGLEKNRFSVVRTNGLHLKSAILENSGEALILLKIRAKKQLRTFKLRTEDVYYFRGVGHMKLCVDSYREILSEDEFGLSEQELRDALMITSNGVQVSLSPSEIEIDSSRDDRGDFFEIALRTVNTTLELKLKDLDHSSFTEVGLYQSSCGAQRFNKFLSNSESFLDLSIEAYVDRL